MNKKGLEDMTKETNKKEQVTKETLPNPDASKLPESASSLLKDMKQLDKLSEEGKINLDPIPNDRKASPPTTIMKASKRTVPPKSEDKEAYLRTMRRIYVGADPGKKGCICFLEPGMGTATWFKWDDNLTALIQKLDEFILSKCRGLNFNPIKASVIEKPQAMGGRGKISGTSLVSMGMSFGVWRMFCAMMNIPRKELSPSQWKSGLIKRKKGQDVKKAAIVLASELYPSLVSKMTLKSKRVDDNMAEALLMAHKAMLLTEGIK